MPKPNEITNTTFKEHFEKGLLTDLVRAEQALSVYNCIGEIANKFPEKKDDSQKIAAAYIQTVCLNEKVLALSRIFDKFTNEKVNDTLCLQYVLNKLKNKSVELPAYSQEPSFINYCIENRFPAYWIELAEKGERKELLFQVALYFEHIFLNQDVRESIKIWRDNYLSHNDKKKVKATIKRHEQDELIHHLWHFITLIGLILFNTFYGHGGRFMLQEDAEKTGWSVQQTFLKALGIDWLNFARQKRGLPPL